MYRKALTMLAASSTGGLFLLLDQFLKFTARSNEHAAYYLIDPWLGWEYFRNFGIAFSLPVSQFLVIPVSFIIIGALIIYTGHAKQRSGYLLFGTALVVSGAFSNIIDRMFFGYTIDYIRIVTSVINVADVCIVAGALLLAFSEYKKRQQSEESE